MSAALHISKDFECNFQTSIETQDHEDHTFNGIFFDLSINDPTATNNDSNSESAPLAFVRIDSLSVRGALGPMTIWTTKNGQNQGDSNDDHDRYFSKCAKPNEWQLLLKDDHVEPSWQTPTTLHFDTPVVLRPGEKAGFYVHSARESDDGIVYDNHRPTTTTTYKDDILSIYPGYAHLSPIPFARRGPWGYSAWRSDRAFVGKIHYGAKFVLWTPSVHRLFPRSFREATAEMVNVHSTSWDGLPSEVVTYILNFCPADWFKSSIVVSMSRGGARGLKLLRKSAEKVTEGGVNKGGSSPANTGTSSSRSIVTKIIAPRRTADSATSDQTEPTAAPGNNEAAALVIPPHAHKISCNECGCVIS